MVQGCYPNAILRRSGIPPADLINVYSALIRSTLQYSSEVWSNSLPQYLSDELERVQKRVMRIIFPDVSYDEALEIADCETLDKRRNAICIKTLRASVHQYNIRNSSDVSLHKCRTERFKNRVFSQEQLQN
jgi:hypothetical protein